jgi:hemolysin III
VSALYHCGTWTEAWRCRLQRLDHAMIFFLIAGTATPTFVLALRGGLGVAGLIVLWTLTGTAAVIHMTWMNAPERLVGGTFIALGWVAALALPEVWIHSGAVPGVLMVAGGLLYLTGAVSYHFRWPDPYPSVFGYHEVFHVFVCAAAACQYAAIALYIV